MYVVLVRQLGRHLLAQKVRRQLLTRSAFSDSHFALDLLRRPILFHSRRIHIHRRHACSIGSAARDDQLPQQRPVNYSKSLVSQSLNRSPRAEVVMGLDAEAYSV